MRARLGATALRRTATIAACAACFGAGAVAVAIGGSAGQAFNKASKKAYIAKDGTRIGAIGITGAGLPDVGGTSTYGVAELTQSVRAYHDSGQYDKDLAKVGDRARHSLNTQLKRLAANKGPGRYSKCGKGKCKQVKPAIVLDIDETSLSNYTGLNATNFSQAGLVPGALNGDDPVIAPTLKIYDLARKKGVKVAFITGRPDIAPIESAANSNLQNAGYDQGYSLTLKPSDAGTTIEYKSGERKKLVKKGFTILANVGDQDSDLQGGFAERAFKYPNPFYFIP